MPDEKGAGSVAVMVALIGSLGGAWITTGAKFEQKYEETLDQLHRTEARVDSMQHELESVRGQIAQQRQAATELATRLTVLHAQTDTAGAQVERLRVAATKLNPQLFPLVHPPVAH